MVSSKGLALNRRPKSHIALVSHLSAYNKALDGATVLQQTSGEFLL